MMKRVDYLQKKSFMSAEKNFAFFVESMLLRNSLMSVMSATLVLVAWLQVRRSQPTVKRV